MNLPPRPEAARTRENATFPPDIKGKTLWYNRANPVDCLKLVFATQMINDDRLVMHTSDNWEYGSDDTGDVLDCENRAGIVSRILSRFGDGRVDVVTADGSIDCQGDPANQESIVSALHLSEVAIALNVLSAGGSFVLKMFTLFEPQSRAMMFLLAAAFDEVCPSRNID